MKFSNKENNIDILNNKIKTIKTNKDALAKFLWYFLFDIGENNLTPEGENASRTEWENNPKNKYTTIWI